MCARRHWPHAALMGAVLLLDLALMLGCWRALVWWQGS